MAVQGVHPQLKWYLDDVNIQIDWKDLYVPLIGADGKEDETYVVMDDFLINPPGLAPVAIHLIEVLSKHPTYAGWINIRPCDNALVRSYEVQEII